MSRNNAHLMALTVLAAAGMCTSAALADEPAQTAHRGASRSSRSQPATRGARTMERTFAAPAEQRAGAVEVHENFARDLENGCEYQSKVRGVVLPATSAASNAHSELFAPNLRISTVVRCPNLPSIRTEGVIRSRALTAEQLARSVQQRARVRTSDAEGTCSYAPSFQFDRQQLAGRDVNFTCRAREGGVTEGGVYVDPDAQSREID